MVEKRQMDWNRIMLAFFIATFLFLIGIIFGYVVRDFIGKSTIDIEQTINNEFVSLETLSMLQKDFPCDSFILEKSSQRLDYLGNLINTLELRNGKDDSTVLELKRFYSILETRHYILTKERNNRCNGNFTTILYFYSNKKECEKEVKKISFILSYIRKKYEHVRVYSYDINLNSDIVELFKNTYDLTPCTDIVLNDKKINEDVENSDQIEKYIKN